VCLIVTEWRRQEGPSADYIITSNGCQFRITEAWREKEANGCHGAVNLFLINCCWLDAIYTNSIMAPNEVVWKGFSAHRHVVRPAHAISCYFSKPLCLWILIERNKLKVRKYLHSNTTSTTAIAKRLYKILKYQISWKFVLWEPSCSMQSDRHDEANSRFSFYYEWPKKNWTDTNTDIQTDGQTDKEDLLIGC
jgi:hypothetical protein